MSTMQAVEIENLAAFRRDLRRAEAGAARELAAALRKVGNETLVPAIRDRLPKITGALAKGVKVSVRGSTASIVNKVGYGPGSEWGSKGKWTGWVERYGAPPRFVWPTIEDKAEQLAEEIADGLQELISIHGWARR